MTAESLRAQIREVPDFPKPGILFYDITTLIAHADSFREAIALMTEPFRDDEVDIVVGMESRGFIFSTPMALELTDATGSSADIVRVGIERLGA